MTERDSSYSIWWFYSFHEEVRPSQIPILPILWKAEWKLIVWLWSSEWKILNLLLIVYSALFTLHLPMYLPVQERAGSNLCHTSMPQLSSIRNDFSLGKGCLLVNHMAAVAQSQPLRNGLSTLCMWHMKSEPRVLYPPLMLTEALIPLLTELQALWA